MKDKTNILLFFPIFISFKYLGLWFQFPHIIKLFLLTSAVIYIIILNVATSKKTLIFEILFIIFFIYMQAKVNYFFYALFLSLMVSFWLYSTKKEQIAVKNIQAVFLFVFSLIAFNVLLHVSVVGYNLLIKTSVLISKLLNVFTGKSSFGITFSMFDIFISALISYAYFRHHFLHKGAYEKK